MVYWAKNTNELSLSPPPPFCLRPTWLIWYARFHRKEMILNCWKEVVVERVVCLICACWLATRNLSHKSRRHVNQGSLNRKLRAVKHSLCKAWSRSENSFVCFAYCQKIRLSEFRPPGSLRFISPKFSANIQWHLPWTMNQTCVLRSYVSPW